MYDVNDRSRADADVAERLDDLRLLTLLERVWADSESVREEECPEIDGLGAEEERRLIRRMISLGERRARGELDARGEFLEAFSIFSRIKMLAYFQGLDNGLSLGERRES